MTMEQVREKILKVQHLQFLVIRAHVEGKITNEENVLYVNYITDQILVLFPNEADELTKLRDENDKLRRLLVRYKAWDKEEV